MPKPYLFGVGEDLTPMAMRLCDVNGDGVAYLIGRVKDEQIVYLDRDSIFNLITAKERM
ncbi:hypothetical protein [Chloroflexus sp.]|uniref:hypothetical protein n=1 Tax=Chloroflexus sp. TaxID=1904827 RepID=UPI002ACE34E2|nr:hypothetical protein [Chloroflexus sp.]